MNQNIGFKLVWIGYNLERWENRGRHNSNLIRWNALLDIYRQQWHAIKGKAIGGKVFMIFCFKACWNSAKFYKFWNNILCSLSFMNCSIYCVNLFFVYQLFVEVWCLKWNPRGLNWTIHKCKSNFLNSRLQWDYMNYREWLLCCVSNIEVLISQPH